MEILEIATKLRSKLTDYRYFYRNSTVGVDINAIDIALSLVEYAIRSKRQISVSEQNWFEATYVLDYVLSGSDWEDLVDLYSQLVTEVKRCNYFR